MRCADGVPASAGHVQVFRQWLDHPRLRRARVRQGDGKLKIANPIRGFAVLCVAVTSAFVMYMSYHLLQILSGPGWCATALGAGKAASADGSPVKGLEACVGLLTIQLKSLATNSFVFGGVIAMCLLTLIVIVIAGGKISG